MPQLGVLQVEPFLAEQCWPSTCCMSVFCMERRAAVLQKVQRMSMSVTEMP